MFNHTQYYVYVAKDIKAHRFCFQTCFIPKLIHNPYQLIFMPKERRGRVEKAEVNA